MYDLGILSQIVTQTYTMKQSQDSHARHVRFKVLAAQQKWHSNEDAIASSLQVA
jgi:hypothetical protein